MTRRQKKTAVRIGIAAVLLIVAWLLPLEGAWKLLAFVAPYLVIGYDVLWDAIRNILRGQVFDEQFLMALATIGAFAIGEYPEGVAVMLFFQIGEWFQGIAVGKSRKSIAKLMDIRPDYATLFKDGEEKTVFPDQVAVGDVILVRPGEKIPLDGIVIEGESTVDTTALTGESVPRACRVGDEVISGTVNLNGVLKIEVAKSFGESTVSKILELVENSALKKAKAEKFITRFARYYTPCVVICATLLAVVPSLIVGGWSGWIHRALIFLVVSCPCALVISVPLSFFGGIGGASRKGILIKGANYLEALAKVKSVVFDKTGTLTRGTFEVTAIHPQNSTEQDLLGLAALAEGYSNHPIAQSIVRAYKGELDFSRVIKTEELSGKGIRAVIDGKEVLIGNEKLVENFELPQVIGTVVYLSVDGEYRGCIVISDALKEDAAQAIADLKAVGVSKTVMLTGDRKAVGDAVAAKLGLDRVEAELLPHQKVEKVEELLAEKPNSSTLAYVGDGINDAPVLTRADVGIAMGALGSDAAIEAADVVLMDDQPAKISVAVRLAKKTMDIVYQNIIFTLGVKGIVLILGALGFAGMWLAVFADVGVMVLAILNAMRCLK